MFSIRLHFQTRDLWRAGQNLPTLAWNDFFVQWHLVQKATVDFHTYPVLIFHSFRAWSRSGLKQQYLHQVPRTKQSSVTDSSAFLSIALIWSRKRHVTLVTSERYVHLRSTGSISSLSQCDAPGLCPNRSGTSLGVPALRLHASDVTLEMHHIMFSWLTSEQIQCDSVDDAPCNWCQHQNLACTFDRVRGRRKPAVKSRLVHSCDLEKNQSKLTL